MSRRKKYRKEVATGTAHAGDGDHYAIIVRPPRSDDEYCRIQVDGRTWGKGGRHVESRSEAIDYLQGKIDELDEKARDDKYRGSLPRYPEPPKPANTRFRVHPDFADEIGARELWGDATLASFGADSGSKYDDRPWYQHRDAYQEHLALLRDGQDERVLRVLATDIGRLAYFWHIVHDGDLYVAKYRPEHDRADAYQSDWTPATRRLGAVGITNPPAADIREFGVEETPFANGVSEDAVLDWLDEHEPTLLEKSEANQIDETDDESGRSLADVTARAGGESA